MKHILFAASIAALSGHALAEGRTPANYGYLGLHLSRHYFDIGGHIAAADFDSSLMPGIQLGVRFRDQWSIQGSWSQMDMDFAVGAGEAEFRHYFISARHHYRHTDWLGFEPYSGAAIGQLEIDANEETLGAFEVGLMRGLGNKFVVDLGLRPNYSFDNERWNGEIYAAINFVVGAASSKNKKPVL